ncbi:phosphate ABC transporter substrate-binding protein [Paenibacillus faecis]|uniref:TIGR03943 family putative permease subunit n=1 Tax=Paenibacillus faecis TaxID=862114 RepID=UPI001B15BC8D|nr:TIGR03943 family protein [Paenibacillus faecis]GIO84368.1 phosphate ABC transporter substrate-binding protein [Paenibacillus faecis]
MKFEAVAAKRHYLLRAFILLGFALYISHLATSGKLQLYVAPEMQLWLRLSVIPLVLVAVTLVYHAFFAKENGVICECGMEHEVTGSAFKHTLAYALFLTPLLLGLVLPDRALDGAAATRKGMILGSPVLSREQLDGKFKAPDKYNEEFAELAKRLYIQDVIEVKPEIFSEMIGAIELFKEDFRGKKIKLSGFVYQKKDAPNRSEFVLSRFLVQCCTADAYPFGVPVSSVAPLPSLRNDIWVEVEGTLQTGEHDGKEIITISAERVSEIPRPDSPYIFLNSNAVMEYLQRLDGPL